MTPEQKLLIGALGTAMTGAPCALPADVNWLSFMNLTSGHGLSPLVCDGLQKNPEVWAKVPETVQNRLFSAYMQAIYRDTQSEHRKALLESALGQANIPHIFLKGAVLKHNYPVPALRTMSDLDILVYAKDFDAIATIAEQMDAQTLDGDGNHRNYVFPGGVVVEFHPNLLHHATAVGTGINPGWQYAKESQEMTKSLTEEGLYLNTICHIAEHFVDGGVGVRFLLDVWVHKHLRKEPVDCAFVDEELTRIGLLDFARNLEQLADVWFSQQPATPLLEELGQYILTSGSYGTQERAVLNAVSLSDGGNRASALWKKVFYPKSELEDRFPWCKDKPLLLPAAWFCRAYKAVTVNGKLIAQWSRKTGQVSRDEATQQREKLRRFGIEK